MTIDNCKEWLSTNCPTFWSFLKNKAQQNLPKGITEYIGQGSKDQIETGRNHILTIERYLCELISCCGKEQVGDIYRRDISGVQSEQTLSEIFCEIALCAKVSSFTNKITLRPKTGKGTQSDCKFSVGGYEIYGEVKRYQDSWPYTTLEKEDKDQRSPYSRSIYKSPSDKKPLGTKKPRYMDIQSKLLDVHRQFPDDTKNVLFIFHPGLTSTRDYLVQALLGRVNYGKNEDELTLEADGLFAIKEWNIISACCLVRAPPNDRVVFPLIIQNPNNPIEKEVFKKLRNA